MKVKIVILAVSIYCVTLLVNLPAALVVSWAPTGGVEISNVKGSIWQGQAKAIKVDSKLTLKNVKWDIQLMALLSLALEAKVTFENGPQAMSGEAVVRYGLSGASASNVLLDLSSDELVALLPMSLPVKISGDFSAAIKEVTEGKPYCEQLDGVVVWNNANVYSQFGNVDLDSPSIDLRCDEGNISAFVMQKSDQLTTTLDVNLSEGGRYQLNGEIKGTDKLAPSIAQSLSWVGPVNDSGATTISFNGNL